MWSTFVQHYKDPLLVAKIQEFFGIQIHYKNNSHEETKNKSGNEKSKSEKNGLNSEKSSTLVHGSYNQINENTTRERHKDVLSPSSEISAIENTKSHTIKNQFWYYLFVFGTELGDEIFYSLFFPFWIWNIDGTVGRRIILVWSIILTTGQVLKDIICWPRPSCPPAVRLQKKWSLEYGMPSTHAMIAVSIPFSAVFFTKNKYIYSFSAGFVIAILWCLLICVSRIYLGMHTVLDVIAGLVLASGMMIVLVPLVDAIDDYFITNNWAILTLFIIGVGTIVYHPTSGIWTPTRGDTALVVGTGTGIHLGYWINYKTGILTASQLPPPYNITWPTNQDIVKIISRTLLGFTYILVLKALIKSFIYFIMCAILKVNSKELKRSENSLENKNKILVDLVYKYIFCFVITCSMTSVLPKIFTVIGIERPTFYTEL
ncbi:sphingosine-1-phosphate phosphatase 1-like [Copidosoma floridanum]|uniref:sphingosine-1-phosphate phosphatase 1-like n=1 Tax=Copidosoma floridanum TaxID=29053 RepID=UPI0006C9AE6B|nr:sphingosine-1-phosphate phosphatase 1-like [Copidosoma floridanum]